MLTTKRKPATVGEILVEEFMQPMGLTQAALAEAMGVQRKHVNELCNDRRTVTAATALILARVFGNSPDFWLNVQRRSDLWEAMNNPRERERIERATPLGTAARSLSPGRGRMLWRRNRPFRSRRLRAILAQCPPPQAYCRAA
jgi:addiction module HigA family antidote